MAVTGTGTDHSGPAKPASQGDGHLALPHQQRVSHMAGKASFACDRHVCLPSCGVFLSPPLSRSLNALLTWLTASHIAPINRTEQKTLTSLILPSILTFFL